MKMAPKSAPQIKRDAALTLARGLIAGLADKVYLIGIRGYYRDTMGAPGKNDRGIYDDAMILIGPEHFSTYNANTDPTAGYRKHLACLKPGLWRYKLGTHGLNRPASQRYQALVQADKVTVIRDGEGPDTGYFGINIHRGGVNTTSSLGCQTIVPSQWPAFIGAVKDQLTRAEQKVISYALIENVKNA